VRETVATDDHAAYRTDGDASVNPMFITACSMDEYTPKREENEFNCTQQ